MVVAFIDGHRDRFGVEPICRVLTEHGITIAPSTYYAAKNRPPSTRRCGRAALVEIAGCTDDRQVGRGVYGARKVWHQLRRDRRQHRSPGCTVERLMREPGCSAPARRGRRHHHDPAPPRRGRRTWWSVISRASRPNRLWVVDFTYVPTWSGMAFTAFVIDVFSRRIVGWRTATSMPTELPLDALEMALWTRDRRHGRGR